MEYEVIRSRRKTLSMRIKDGRIEIRAPLPDGIDLKSGFFKVEVE